MTSNVIIKHLDKLQGGVQDSKLVVQSSADCQLILRTSDERRKHDTFKITHSFVHQRRGKLRGARQTSTHNHAN